MTTPVGVLVYPSLTTPNYGTKEYPDVEGSFQTRLILDKNDPNVQAFLSKLDEVMEQSRLEALEKFEELALKTRKTIEEKGGVQPNKPYSDIYDEETEEATGEVVMRIKRKASGKTKEGKKWQAPPPPLFDSAIPPKLLPRTIEVWSGSKGRVNLEVTPYFTPLGQYGVMLRLNAVQITSLVSRGSVGSAEDYGFEGDGGFDFDSAAFEEAIEPAKEAAPAATENEDDYADF